MKYFTQQCVEFGLAVERQMPVVSLQTGWKGLLGQHSLFTSVLEIRAFIQIQ